MNEFLIDGQLKPGLTNQANSHPIEISIPRRVIDAVNITAYTLPIRAKVQGQGFTIQEAPGGLVTALSSVDQIGIWRGTAGIPDSPALRRAIERYKGRTKIGHIGETDEEHTGHYAKAANSYIWPGMHDELEVWDLKAGMEGWSHYESGNIKFASEIVKTNASNVVEWVHDYHLFLVAQEVRQLRGNNYQDHLAFFGHIPWANINTFSQFPHREQIIRAMLHFDSIGLHTKGYVQNFLNAVREFAPYSQIEQTPQGLVVRTGDHLTKIADIPIGINPEEYADKIGSSQWRDQVQALRREIGMPDDTEYMIDAGRIDHTKGYPESIESLVALYQQHPELIGKLSLLLVAQPSREQIPAYQVLKQKLLSQIKGTNERFQTPNWKPIYHLEGLPREQLIAAISEALIAKITPLVDGMNLVAMEAAAYMRKGALVLSQYAGAADQDVLGKHALLVNPRRPDEVAKTTFEAYTMPEQERLRLLQGLRGAVHNTTAKTWADKNIALAAA